MLNTKLLLVPVDFTPKSELALEWAVGLADKTPGACILLCHILPPPAPGISRNDVPFQYLLDEKTALQSKLDQWRKEKIPQQIASATILGEGSIAKEVARLCQERAIDLVIMTTEGRRGLPHLLKGSSTEEAVRLAPCPVLVLHLNPKTVLPTETLQATP